MADQQDGPRVLSIEEANALVPELLEKVGPLLRIGDAIEHLLRELGPHIEPRTTDEGEVVDISPTPEDSDEVREMKESLGMHVGAYRHGWRQIEELGAVVKDTRIGLLDFYGRVDDRLVWLCWRYGEQAIDYYHELDRGFAGRKPLSEVRDRMLN